MLLMNVRPEQIHFQTWGPQNFTSLYSPSWGDKKKHQEIRGHVVLETMLCVPLSQHTGRLHILASLAAMEPYDWILPTGMWEEVRCPPTPQIPNQVWPIRSGYKNIRMIFWLLLPFHGHFETLCSRCCLVESHLICIGLTWTRSKDLLSHWDLGFVFVATSVAISLIESGCWGNRSLAFA